MKTGYACFALKRRWVLLITYTRPLRRTTRQSLWRFFKDLSDERTFMTGSFQERWSDIERREISKPEARVNKRSRARGP